MASTRGKTFFAKVAKGYIPKTTFDALATSMSRITLRLTKRGIFIREFDADELRFSHILWDVSWPRKMCSLYRCVKEYVVTLNAKHLQKMLRNVKKKDSLTFFIRKNDESQIGITIQPTGAQSDGPAARSETVYLSIQHVDKPRVPMVDLPENYVDADGNEKAAYGFPMVIGATDFQKIKKMSGAAKALNVKIQGGNYISFYAGDATVMSSRLTFGEMTMHPESDNEEDLPSDEETDDEDPEDDTGVESENSEFLTDEETGSDFEDEDSQDAVYYSEDEEIDEEFPSIYEGTFAMSLFVPLVKLPGLTLQMEFYAPKVDQFPLKVSMHASSGLGDITVFVKDAKQIALDEQNKSQEVGSATSGKGKRAKKR